MNKKLLKSIVCIASGVGVATSIPFTVSSCGESSEKINALPESVYKINQSTHDLEGFKPGISLSIYDGKCDTMLIPDEVTSITAGAFRDNVVPPFINKIVFSKNSKCNTINGSAFKNCSSITSVTLSGALYVHPSIFEDCSNLSSITWNACVVTSVASSSFKNISQSGTIKVTNPVNGFNSEALLRYLKANAGLPNNWAASN